MKNKFKPIETYFIVHMMTFGLILLYPSNTFSNPVYHTMSLIAKEEYWGVLCVLISLIQLFSMLIENRNMKIISLSLTTFLWSSIGTMFLIESVITNLWNTGITYICIAGFALWLAHTIGGQKNE